MTTFYSCVHNFVPSPSQYFLLIKITSNHFCHQRICLDKFDLVLMMPFCFDHLIIWSWFYDVITWCRWSCDKMWLKWWVDENSLCAHLTGSGSESSLPEVSSVVASGRIVVISIGMESTAPSATKRQPRNFSISPARQCRYNQSLSRCQGIAGESRQSEERYLPCVSTQARGWLVRTKGARERVDLYSRQEMAHA